MKILLVGDTLIRVDRQTDRRTDMAKIVGVFRLHTNAPNEVIWDFNVYNKI